MLSCYTTKYYINMFYQLSEMLFSHTSHILTVPIGRSNNGLLSLSHCISGAGWPSAGHLSSTVLPAVSQNSWWNSIFFAQVGAFATIKIKHHHKGHRYSCNTNHPIICIKNCFISFHYIRPNHPGTRTFLDQIVRVPGDLASSYAAAGRPAAAAVQFSSLRFCE